MDARQRTYAYAGGAGLILLLLVRWYSNSHQAAGQSAGTQTGAGDPSAASAYASLAGQEQSDVAALQSQGAQLLSQEQSDVQNLSAGQFQQTADMQAFQAQETGDVQTLQAGIASGISQAVSSAVLAVAPAVNNVTHEVAAVAAGQQAVSRATVVHPRPGGQFYDWYKSIYHRPPPGVVNNANPVYVAYQRRVSKATVKRSNPRGIR